MEEKRYPDIEEAELQSAKIALWKRLPSFLGLTIFSLIGRKDLMADSH